ncbi:unnamed protein product [Microthlaspi erraticum]|uniref:MBD domain-containing protein n=1 Tax=Microthlaspi erraticum TaxID=1685480 RepID=A0A6D2J775_9BRAS|nr:unnamed protein product [Microthlaspi erraticum]
MLRQLPPTVTADQTPDWLPVGWIVHSTVLKRGRQTRTYTHLGTGKKFSTKDQVLEYIKMQKIREEREFGVHRRKLKASQDREAAIETPSWLQDYWKTGSYSGNQSNTISENVSNVPQTNSKLEASENQNDMESESSSEDNEETGCNQIAYIIDESEEDLSETEYFEYKCSQANVETPIRSQPERMKKLDSRAKTQCVFEDEEMNSDGDKKLPESKEEAHLEEQNLHDAVVEYGDKEREIFPGLTGTFSIEINLDPSDCLVEKDLNKSWTEGIETRNVDIRDEQGNDLMHMNAPSSKVVEESQESGDKSEEPSKVVETTQESGDKSEEPLEAQAAQEETANESRRSVFFPDREAPPHSLLVFGNSNAADDLINTITTPEKNISGGSIKRGEKKAKPCSSKNIKKKDTEQKKPQNEEKGSSSSVSMEKETIDWPKPCPYFAFEPITRSFQEEDDSVIRRYLEQHVTAASGSAVDDSNRRPLPDFGLPCFSKIKISSLNEEEPESKKMKFPDPPPCVQFASSSLDGCSFRKRTVAGN